MDIAAWSAVIGLLLILMALGDSLLARLPLSTSMLYLAFGAAISPLWLDWTHDRADLARQARSSGSPRSSCCCRCSGSGLKMSLGLGDGRWLLPLRLAIVSMLVTVALIAAAGVAWLGLPLGAAILLGGILAPTDPVLASDVQVAEPGDRDRLRFALTGEAGLNDGTAFPFVMLGLGLLGLHELGPSLWRWFAVDVLWGVGGRLGIGAGARHAGRPARPVPAPHPQGGGRPRQLPRPRPDRRCPTASPAGPRLRLPRRVRRRRRPAPARAAGQRRRRRDPVGRATRRKSGGAAPALGRDRRRGARRSRRVARREGGDRPEARAGLHGPRGARLQRADRAHRRGRAVVAVGALLWAVAVAARLVGFVAAAAARDPARCRSRSAWSARRLAAAARA